MRILVAEDNEELRFLLHERLSEVGYEVSVARDGQEAVTLMRGLALDLLISDILMPEKDGLEVIEEFRKLFPGKPIVAMSGGSERLKGNFCLDLARRLGAQSVLEKPFTIPELLQAIGREDLSRVTAG